ncbi:NAD(P)H-binding protein [Arthrobacter sp. I2-34]|uniref:NAD(P)H-binding protein n=1 Tax=Arthrobacter hankyongi TaxID=2904801 RepID=A0ABS9L1I9_9MICC|nr:NAD(P)H-binding protein [Arthrobacter hankyongi]MCG2620562.1 NAD(P)H-binding protein [Arthrobacter hankyongi]
MTRVLVAGGTGLVGSAVVAECLARAADVRVISRHTLTPDSPRRQLQAQYLQADVAEADGLNAALADVDVVVDVLNGGLSSARRTLADGAKNLAAAAAAAGVRRLVVLSIVNVDEVEFGYYQAKTAQETIYRESRVPAAIVRATQFHEFVTAVFDSGRRLRITPRFRGAKFQTIAVADVAKALAETALSDHEPDRIRNIGGPEVLGMDAMARIYRQFTGVRGPVVPVPLPGALGKYFRNGGNLTRKNAVGKITYAQWLEAREAESLPAVDLR